MKLLRQLSCLVLIFVIVGCGGSGGSLSRDDVDTPDTPSPDTPVVEEQVLSLSLSLSERRVTGSAPVTASATLLLDNVAVPNQLIQFDTTIGALAPNDGTALTNENGVAEIALTAGQVRGAGLVSATYTPTDGEELVVSQGFETQGDDIGVVGDINITVALVDSEGNTTETITSSKSGQIIATVNGISSPVIVSFSSTVGDIPIATAITNADNQAIVDILAGSDLGAGTLTASIESGEQGQGFVIIGSTTVVMGSGTPFQENVAEISLTDLSAGGTTVISVDILDDQGNPFTESVDVNFTSSCGSSNQAILSSPITTSNGRASSTYLAQGCVGEDVINVSANAGGINLSAQATVNVLAADIGSLEFESASPENIVLLGTGAVGGSESSVVKFKVLDENGNPVNNQDVDFSLNTEVGGITINPSSATTNAEGIVQTVINSGTVATTVRVTASVAGSNPLISSQSSLLVVSTGIPDQDSFSLSADILNVEGWNVDGKEVQVTARLADAFNNPVPNGTAVNFTTEGGSIEPSCVTENGTCTVVWRSQNPRPEGNVLGDANNLTHLPEEMNTMGQKYGGRATILATAIGEESFPDLNGNGRFDESEFAAFSTTDTSGNPFDLSEAFLDHNEDGVYNPEIAGGEIGGELERFSDFDSSGNFTLADNQYNGVLCSLDDNPHCSTQKSLNVRSSLVIVMSGSEAFLTVTSTNDAVSTTFDDDDNPNTPEIANPNFDATDNTIYIAGENTGSASVIIADLHNQPMPAGTVVSFTATAGSVQGSSSFTWPNDNHNGGRSFSVNVKGQEEPASGNLIIEITTPDEVTTVYGSIGIVIQ